MSKRAFGTRDPLQDARRVRTAQIISEAGANSILPASFALENKIYLWPGDGGAISTFDPDQAGLIAALAAAISGDTVWLPSIPIALTAAITVPASVTLIGISDNATLNFSGFSGTAITLSASSELMDFTVTMLSNGTTAIGVEAQAEGAIVQHVRVTASGGSTTNIAIGAGVATTITQATEAWLMTGAIETALEDSIAWSTDYDSGDPHWYEVASLPDDDNPMIWAGMSRDGSTLYAAYGVVFGVYGFAETLYKCHNPKEASPTWNLILAAGTDTGAGVVVQYFNYTIGPFVLEGNELHTVAYVNTDPLECISGTYDGSQWTWHFSELVGASSPDGAGYHALGMLNHIYIDGSDADNLSARQAVGFEYHRSAAGRMYCITTDTDDIVQLREIGVSDLATLGTNGFSDYMIGSKISGSETGAHVYCVSYFADFWRSTDGTNFTNTATWKPGFVRDKALAGGGTLAWTSIDTIAVDESIGQLSTDNGATWPLDLTGNWWTAIASVDTNFRAVGFSLVFA